MSSISQTKVPLVNIFFGNMIRLNKFPSWLSQNWIFFESPNDRTTCPVIHGFARTMLDSDRTLSVDRPLFQALLCKHWFTSSVWNFWRQVADVPPCEMSFNGDERGETSAVRRLKWHLRSNYKNSILMMCHYTFLGDASDWLKQMSLLENQWQALPRSG